MSRISREFSCPPEAVFEVLKDGWLYPTWVVGASRMRSVDSTWPQVDSKLHHSFGTWPLLVNDTTSSMEFQPPERFRLRARGWPGGEAEVLIEVTPSAKGCTVTIIEDVVAGPGKLLPRPVRTLVLDPRNKETLRRLAFIAEGKTPR